MPVLEPNLPEFYKRNKAQLRNMAVTTVNRFLEHNVVQIPQQRSIYQHLSLKLANKSVIEYGCGIGIGSHMIALKANLIATDILPANIAFAAGLYPEMQFKVWDIMKSPVPMQADAAVAIEVLEHVDDAKRAMETLVESAPEAYVSSPNRNHPLAGKMKPRNHDHVAEYTPDEIIEMLPDKEVTVLDSLKFIEVGPETRETPVVYHIK